MSVRTLVWTSVLALAAAASPEAAERESGTVTTTGEAEVRVAPDEVVLTLGVETNHGVLTTAKQANDERAARIIDAARRLGLPAKDIQTDFLEIMPQYPDDEQRADVLRYWVRKSIVLTVREVGRFEQLLEAALQAGATHVHGVSFRTTELRKHRDEARALAIRAAREKAVALGRELGTTIGRPRRIDESGGRWWSPYASWWGGGRWQQAMQNAFQTAAGGGGEAADGSVALGQISVTASVSVTFELEAGRE